ncbi:Smb1p [Saccharomyces cerevisiae x Saccharomyces kudriavzevii VIN7]|uniref:Sm protein B n=1 Tax=Saccharomyces cerevisiae x Saccharomyces kudriavzevii (strain VIN7) TaxID=1095631 RepID=H0GTT1_SACCK|nr:Smb1p [Saccharomyces cerevisiae x Saccharomyces kudriavzevii VIN7]
MSRVQVAHGSRLANLIDYKLRVLTQDGRVYIGQLMAFDKHMNLVLNECIEERVPKTQLDKLRPKKDSKDGTSLNIKVEKKGAGSDHLKRRTNSIDASGGQAVNVQKGKSGEG